MKKGVIFIVLFLMISGIIWLGFSIDKKYFSVNSNKISVVTTLFPLYDFARIVGGDNASVSLLLPPGVDPHSFEPKPGDIFKINQSQIFIYTGDLMEPWAKDILAGINNKNLAVVNASNGVAMIPAVFHDSDETVGSMDPHIWLDFNNDKIIVNSIAHALISKDPANKAYYEQRAAAYEQQLTDLDNEYASTLNTCSSKEIIYGGHYAFGYLAKRYGLNYVAAQGVSPDAEPTANDLAMLVNQIKKDGIKYVFYEELTSPKIAETLANETGAKLLLLNAAHNVSKSDIDQGVTFIDIMNRNLANLKIGLQCQ
jgi:zinc transport system substrate-binding protein